MPFDPAAARATILGPEQAKLAEYARLMDDLDATISRTLDFIADRGYAGGGTIVYPDVDLDHIRDATSDTPWVRRVAWVFGAVHNPGSFDSSPSDDLYLLDETAAISVCRYGDRARGTGFESLHVVPAYQSSTRHVNNWSLSSPLTNPILLRMLLTAFLANPEPFPIVDSTAIGDCYAQYKAVVGDVVL